MCKHCNIEVLNALAPAFEQTLQKHDKRIFTAIFNGKFNSLIDVEQTKSIAENFSHVIAESINVSSENATETFAEIQATMQANAQAFSVYKNAKYIQELQLAMQSVNTEKAFLEIAKNIAQNYNQNYLRTETNWAQRVAAQSTRWQDIQAYKDKFPLLQFHTREDVRVRYKHTLFNELIFPVEHPFWKMNYPPIWGDWGCRCFVTQEFEGDISTIDEKYVQVDESRISPAISNKIFDEKQHPYFKGWNKDEKKELQAQIKTLST